MNKSTIILAAGIFFCMFTSCVTNKKLLKEPPAEVDTFSAEKINGQYVNKVQQDSLTSTTLWEIFYTCKSMKEDTNKITKNAIITLNYNGKNTLTVTATENNKVMNKIELKGKRYKEYFSINRRLYLVPIPFLYYRHNEGKAAIGVNKNGNLVIKFGKADYIWILLAAGNDDVYHREYDKIK